MTNRAKVVLTRHERKDRLGYGGVNAVAAEVGVHQSLVSRVLNDRQRHQRVEDAIARRCQLKRHELAFPPRLAPKRAQQTAA